MSGIISATAVGSTFGVIFLGLFGLAAHLDMQPYTAGYNDEQIALDAAGLILPKLEEIV